MNEKAAILIQSSLLRFQFDDSIGYANNYFRFSCEIFKVNFKVQILNQTDPTRISNIWLLKLWKFFS
jgi:hypothetical protein